MWNFPNCIGAIDGKHVQIRKPIGSGSQYRCYKQFDSIILMAIVDANLNFIFVDVGTNGRIGDAGVWNKSDLKRAFDQQLLNLPPPERLPNSTISLPYVIVGDEAFALKSYLMKPYSGRGLATASRIHNYR